MGIVTLRRRQIDPMTLRPVSYLRHRFPPEIISHAVWLHHRFCLSFRDVEDLLAQRGTECVEVDSEAVGVPDLVRLDVRERRGYRQADRGEDDGREADRHAPAPIAVKRCSSCSC